MKDFDPASCFAMDFLCDLKVAAEHLRSTFVQQGFSALSNNSKSEINQQYKALSTKTMTLGTDENIHYFSAFNL